MLFIPNADLAFNTFLSLLLAWQVAQSQIEAEAGKAFVQACAEGDSKALSELVLEHTQTQALFHAQIEEATAIEASKTMLIEAYQKLSSLGKTATTRK